MRNGIHTIRGTLPWTLGVGAIPPFAPTRCILDNGNFRENFIIESFEVFPTSAESVSHAGFGTETTFVVLATRPEGAVGTFSQPDSVRGSGADDNRQIGWKIFDNLREQTHLDPDHLVVEDLWLNAWIIEGGTGVAFAPNQELSYIIKMKRVRTPIEQAVLALIKERSQDV